MTKNTQTFLLTVVALVVVVAGVVFLTQPDDRGIGEKFDDAVEKLDDGGIDDAAREFEDRTPAERIGDEIEHATDGNRR